MFENLVNQSAIDSISSDIRKGLFPSAVMFSGNSASGKLSAALETARIFSCKGPKSEKGFWTCECPSCLQHKSLTCSNVLLMGPRDCALEIAAAQSTFVKAYRDNEKHLDAARYLYLRSIRKLTLRFSGILMAGSPDLSKVGSLLEQINDNLEILDFPRELPDFNATTKLCETLTAKALELETKYLPDSIPVNQIRNMEEWAHIKSESGKKTIIIENADQMQTSVRNALLKILEEPPADCIFILLTTRRNAVMPTILSRVRNYTFIDRTIQQQKDVITRVFHNDYFNGSINEYLLTFLPVPASTLREEAQNFYKGIARSSIPDVSKMVTRCNSFEPRISLRIFLNGISQQQQGLMNTPEGCEAVTETLKCLRNCWENVTLYNQSVLAAFDVLVRDLNKINITYGRIFAR